MKLAQRWMIKKKTINSHSNSQKISCDSKLLKWIKKLVTPVLKPILGIFVTKMFKPKNSCPKVRPQTHSKTAKSSNSQLQKRCHQQKD